MKNALVIFTFFFLPIKLWSFQPPLKELQIACVTEIPTTSFIGFSKQGRIEISLINTNGVEYMPIHTGLVTTHDLKVLAKRAQALRVLGRRGTFEFDLKQCKTFQDGTFNCLGGGPFKTESGETLSDVNIFSLSSSLSDTTTLNYAFKRIRIMAGIEVRKESFYIAMDYSPEECSISSALDTQGNLIRPSSH